MSSTSARIIKIGATRIVADANLSHLGPEQLRETLKITYPEIAHATMRETTLEDGARAAVRLQRHGVTGRDHRRSNGGTGRSRGVASACHPRSAKSGTEARRAAQACRKSSDRACRNGRTNYRHSAAQGRAQSRGVAAHACLLHRRIDLCKCHRTTLNNFRGECGFSCQLVLKRRV